MIGYYPALPSIVLLATTFGIFQLWQARSNTAPSGSPPSRYAEIVGLRAFLAINVAVSHLLRTRLRGAVLARRGHDRRTTYREWPPEG
jgi:hypothetical protein